MGGVDVFMFLSGFGLFYAYKKENKYPVFIKRRLIKILPYNIIVCFIQMFTYKRTLLQTIINGFGLTLLFFDELFGWYTSFMMIIYLLTPIYLNIFKRKPCLVTSVGVIFTFLLCLYVNNYEFTYVFFRTAIYLLGIYFAYLYDNGYKINNWFWIILFFIGWALMYYMYHYIETGVQHVYPMFLIVPGMLIILSYFFDKVTIFRKPLNFISKYTYQFYLLQSTVIDFAYKYYGELYHPIPLIGFDLFINIICSLLAFLLAVLLTYIVELASNYLVRLNNGFGI